MGLVERVQRWIRGDEPTMVDYEGFERNEGKGVAGVVPEGGLGADIEGAINAIVGRVGPTSASTAGGPGGGGHPAGTYKIQQSYDSLLSTVQELRSALDGQGSGRRSFFRG